MESINILLPLNLLNITLYILAIRYNVKHFKDKRNTATAFAMIEMLMLLYVWVANSYALTVLFQRGVYSAYITAVMLVTLLVIVAKLEISESYQDKKNNLH